MWPQIINNIWTGFLDPIYPLNDVSFMILALLGFKLQLTSRRDGGHFVFCQYGDSVRRPSWRPSEVQTVWHGRALGKNFAFGRILTKQSLTPLSTSRLHHYIVWCNTSLYKQIMFKSIAGTNKYCTYIEYILLRIVIISQRIPKFISLWQRLLRSS